MAVILGQIFGNHNSRLKMQSEMDQNDKQEPEQQNTDKNLISTTRWK